MLADRLVLVAGASPEKQLLSHPLALDSPASDDEILAACLTSSEPFQASSFTLQAPAQVLSVALGNLQDASAPNAVPSVASWVPRDAAAPHAALSDASSALEKLEAPEAAAQQTATQLLPLLLSEKYKSEAGVSLLQSPTLQLHAEAAACSPTLQVTGAATHSPAGQLPAVPKLADPLCGHSPTWVEYDPERYKPYALPTQADLSLASEPVHQTDAQTQLLDAQPLSTQLSEYAQAFSKERHLCGTELHDAQILSAQSQIQMTQSQGQAETDSHSQCQTQLVGQSPKQAALHRLRSITVKQSQTIKPEGAHQPFSERQTGLDTGGQRAKAAIGVLHEWQTIYVTGETVSIEPAVGKGIEAPSLLLSPRRSSSVAKLRSQSLAKQLQDPRYASLRRLPLVPILGTGIDGSQQSIAGEAGCHVTSEKAEDPREGFMPGSSVTNPSAEELDNPPHQAIAESAGCPVTPQEAEEVSRASRPGMSTAQSAAAASLAADRAGTAQPCPMYEAAAVHLTDINLAMDTSSNAQSSVLGSMLPREPQHDLSLGPPEPSQLLARSTDTLDLQFCSRTGTGSAPECSHQLHQSSSKSEGASPARSSSNPDSSTVSGYQPHLHQDSQSSACLHHDSSMHEVSIRQAVSDGCAVSVYIRSSGTGATVSLEVQELGVPDLQADTAAAMTHPVVSSASKLEKDAMGEGEGSDDAQASSPAQLCQAATAVAEDCLRKEEDRNRQQAATALTEGRVNSAELPEAAQVSEGGHRDFSSSPGGNGQRGVSSSPGRRGSSGQGLLGRLEGGLRSWLGRGFKQTVGQCPLFVMCQESVYTTMLDIG